MARRLGPTHAWIIAYEKDCCKWPRWTYLPQTARLTEADAIQAFKDLFGGEVGEYMWEQGRKSDRFFTDYVTLKECSPGEHEDHKFSFWSIRHNPPMDWFWSVNPFTLRETRKAAIDAYKQRLSDDRELAEREWKHRVRIGDVDPVRIILKPADPPPTVPPDRIWVIDRTLPGRTNHHGFWWSSKASDRVEYIRADLVAQLRSTTQEDNGK